MNRLFFGWLCFRLRESALPGPRGAVGISLRENGILRLLRNRIWIYTSGIAGLEYKVRVCLSAPKRHSSEEL
jgi:hypothetical protein